MTRAVIYARFSSENQRDASIDDQTRNARQLIESNGWAVVQIFSDRASSGATTLRGGYQALLADARDKKFDVVVAESLDRLSRDQEAIAGLFKQLNFLGIEIVTRAEGEINELHVGLKGTMNALFLKDLGTKTHRGLEGRVRQGRSAGGKSYGYDIVKTVDENDKGRLIINAAQANIVLRIFEKFCQGFSPREIAQALNADGIPSPSGKLWRDTTIRGHATRRTGILRNDLYRGKRVWNKLEYRRDPNSSKRVSRVRPPEDWKLYDVPALQIVPDEVWDAAQQRLNGIRASIRSKKIRKTEFWKARRKKHLLTGLVHCGECGSSMSSVGRDYLASAAARNGAGCTNKKGVRRSKIEHAILDGLMHRLMAPELVEEFILAFNTEINKHRYHAELKQEAKQRELDKVTQALEGLYDAIADGLRTDGLIGRVKSLEAKKSALEDEVANCSAPSPRLHPNLAMLYREKVENLHLALAAPETRFEAAEILRELIDFIGVRTEGHGHFVELTGDIVKLIGLPDRQGVPEVFESSVKVVAGAGFEPTTFRL
ncbi:MAG: recombinase family protein [Pseudomonadota bacterium]